ncbi:hypothetical protein [Brevundimonas sp.]|uniref:DUF6894 family protein n=1 Tax=Brevundimonas sp. TaxID=1871086 RepID=UPI0035B43E60
MRYHFDLHDGRTLKHEDGELHPDRAAALKTGQRSLAELIDAHSALWAEGRFSIEVSDQDRRQVGRLTVLAEVLE